MQRANIRPMEQSDVAACAALMADTPLWQRYGVTFASATERLSAGLRSGAVILVAEGPRGEVQGFVWLVVRGAFDRSGYIPLIGVDEASRGQKIGQQLLRAAEDHLRPLVADVFLLCSDFNLDAQRFYERHGYVKVGAIPDYVLPGVAELIYRKRLSPMH